MAGTDHLREFSHWLSTKGCGAIGRAVFADAAPDDTTGVALFLIEVPGPSPFWTFSTGSYIRAPRFRIDCRSTAPSSTQGDYPDISTARDLAQDAYDACRMVGGHQIASTGAAPSTGNWLFALPEQEPHLNGRDERNRVIFSFTVQASRQG